jgi:hypothetical protein
MTAPRTYEIRSARGRPVFAFDDLHRAQSERAAMSRRNGTNYRLFEIERIERELP